MAALTGMDILRQQERLVYQPPPGGLWQMPTPYDDMFEQELLRRKSEQHDSQKMARAMTGTVTVPTRNRYNKRLLLCQP